MDTNLPSKSGFLSNTRATLIAIFTLSILTIITAGSGVYMIASNNSTKDDNSGYTPDELPGTKDGQGTRNVNNYDECVAAGGAILESYPEQCRIGDKSFTRELSEQEKEQLKEAAVKDYSGQSTFATCSLDSECVVSGCNSEICQGASEERLSSICVVPDGPLPQSLGYNCGCVSNKCAWDK